jgi:hypothetical protein
MYIQHVKISRKIQMNDFIIMQKRNDFLKKKSLL